MTDSLRMTRFDGGKNVRERKRHIVSDTGGLLLSAVSHTEKVMYLFLNKKSPARLNTGRV
jgi:hypothetical protein